MSEFYDVVVSVGLFISSVTRAFKHNKLTTDRTHACSRLVVVCGVWWWCVWWWCEVVVCDHEHDLCLLSACGGVVLDGGGV